MALANATNVSIDHVLNVSRLDPPANVPSVAPCTHVLMHATFIAESEAALGALHSRLLNGSLAHAFAIVGNPTVLVISYSELQRLRDDAQKAEENDATAGADEHSRTVGWMLPTLGAVVGALVLTCLVCGYGWRWLRQHQQRARRQRKGHLVFLSYRVATDKRLVGRIYRKLRAKGVNVWWDAVCLEPGKRWEDGFADGLFSSAVFVPVLSRAALTPFAGLMESSRCDNVLLEHRLALELLERGNLLRVYPVLVGSAAPPKLSRGNPTMRRINADFFAEGGLPECTENAPIASVEDKVLEHLTRKGHDAVRLTGADASPKRVLRMITAHQGGFIRGSVEAALDKVVGDIAEMVRGLGEVQEEKDGQGEGTAPSVPTSLRQLLFRRPRPMMQTILVSGDTAGSTAHNEGAEGAHNESGPRGSSLCDKDRRSPNHCAPSTQQPPATHPPCPPPSL